MKGGRSWPIVSIWGRGWEWLIPLPPPLPEALRSVVVDLGFQYSLPSYSAVFEYYLLVFHSHYIYILFTLFQIKPTRCTNFSNLFSELNAACFGQFLCPPSGVFHCTYSNGISHTVLLTACEQAVSKHAAFNSENKFEKLVHLVVLF